MALLSSRWRHTTFLVSLAIGYGRILARASDEVQQPPLEGQAPTFEPGAPRPPPLVGAAAGNDVAGTAKLKAVTLPIEQRSPPTRQPPATRHSNKFTHRDARYVIAVFLKVVLLVGAAVWACKQFCPRPQGDCFRIPVHWAAPMGLPSRGCYTVVCDKPQVLEQGPPKQCTAAVPASAKKAGPLLAPLRILGGAVRERLATLTSASTRAGSAQSVCSEDEDFYRYASQDDEEARCLLRGNSRQTVDDGDGEEDEAALSALLKLRPSVADSLGDEADNDHDDGCAGPLVGNERMGLLNR